MPSLSSILSFSSKASRLTNGHQSGERQSSRASHTGHPDVSRPKITGPGWDDGGYDETLSSFAPPQSRHASSDEGQGQADQRSVITHSTCADTSNSFTGPQSRETTIADFCTQWAGTDVHAARQKLARKYLNQVCPNTTTNHEQIHRSFWKRFHTINEPIGKRGDRTLPWLQEREMLDLLVEQLDKDISGTQARKQDQGSQPGTQPAPHQRRGHRLGKQPLRSRRPIMTIWKNRKAE